MAGSGRARQRLMEAGLARWSTPCCEILSQRCEFELVAISKLSSAFKTGGEIVLAIEISPDTLSALGTAK